MDRQIISIHFNGFVITGIIGYEICILFKSVPINKTESRNREITTF
ncbi:hypothetical protein [uncultured Dysgonomonas sp.]|uniref:Uncharacterized protein n=1 Tax=uncultured Dysgonomonas sp. TaxID=206096 RepID=A0A212J2B1_9BACT|nr:hypothetical protein [uncultured Dysgonomonas sp.]SBV93581.1 conserved hypothetical protein [uncultured Dysgonomonas sp.]